MNWNGPKGGLFVRLTIKDGIDAAALLERAVNEASAAFVPGAAFFCLDGRGRSTLRLSYSPPDEATIREGIARLGWLIAEL